MHSAYRKSPVLQHCNAWSHNKTNCHPPGSGAHLIVQSANPNVLYTQTKKHQQRKKINLRALSHEYLHHIDYHLSVFSPICQAPNEGKRTAKPWELNQLV
jgi:hypothetical protein